MESRLRVQSLQAKRAAFSVFPTKNRLGYLDSKRTANPGLVSGSGPAGWGEVSDFRQIALGHAGQDGE
jgi:hypothetical protein